ncbi:hypothetical protein C8A00DRAFT_14217 [Chaetomidium leptoderma]|uniref:F-box domain-containing protein n=1 Tax=Chaetomidium leptoderma TaxID=669021 RepID=A0AAN6VNW2_9PEZI|nr:hypothetical protein C8A00DRAFT_14217 [Chaetomidium leptoderma]
MNQQHTTVHESIDFLSLPSELRNTIYDLLFLHERPISPWLPSHFFDFCGREKHTPGLLRANKSIHREASSVFYGRNRFDFTAATPDELVAFLKEIGTNNAGRIQHVLIDFPVFLHLDRGDVTLQHGTIGILANIENGCANLRTITTSLQSTNRMQIRLDNLENPNVAAEALKLADTSFRAISSLQEIILQLPGDTPMDHTRTVMGSCGWTLRMTDHVMEEAWGFSDSDDSEYGYDYDDDDCSVEDDSDEDGDF